MNETTRIATLHRLVAIKREDLDRFRQDVSRLETLVDGLRVQWEAAREREQAFLAEAREQEVGSRILHVEEMLERRRYLGHLQTLLQERLTVLDQAVQQRDQARASLDKAYAEVRVLERVAERRIERARREDQRIEYVRADDQEIARMANGRGVYVEY